MTALRTAGAGDAQAIGKVFDVAVREGWSYLGQVVERPLFSQAEWDELVADHAAPKVLIVAVEEQHGVVGFVAAHPADGELFLLFVDPAHGGRGIGKMLLEAAHGALRHAGLSEVFLYTEKRNERAQAVYAAAGYRADGSARTSDFRGVPIEEPRLVKTL